MPNESLRRTCVRAGAGGEPVENPVAEEGGRSAHHYICGEEAPWAQILAQSDHAVSLLRRALVRCSVTERGMLGRQNHSGTPTAW